MADLSRADPRTANQSRGRLTDRRSGVLPERRDTRADRLQTFSSMSSASRGDVAGADALMRSLGMVREAAGDFQQYADAKFKQDEQDNAARGALDQAADQVDEAKAARSNAYRNAVARGRTMAAWNDGLREFNEDIRGTLEQQSQLTLEERQAEVRERIDAFFTDFAIDPETDKLRDFLATPDSLRYLAEQMQQSRPQFEAAALQRIEERFNEESLALFGKNVADSFLSGQPLDLNTAVAALPPTVTDQQRREALTSTGVAVADELHRLGRPADGWLVYLQLLGSAPMGTSAELDTLQNGPVDVDVPPSVPGGTPAKPKAAPKSGAAVTFDKLAAAVMHRESRGDPNAVSPKGARGTMQVMPGTLKDPGYGVRPAANDTPAELERVGRDFLKAMLREYNGNYAFALAAYNAGPGNADKWVAEFGTLPPAEFIARIPFKETREYVKAILGVVGASAGNAGGTAITPDDPVIADPDFRLPDTPRDPIELAERDYAMAGRPPLLSGGLMLTPTERARLTEASQQYAREVRAEWTKTSREVQDREADSMSLRLFGQGARLTSQDITDAAKSGKIRPDQARDLFSLLRQNANMAEQYRDGLEADADRARARSREGEAERLIAHYTGGLYSGRETPAQARARVLRDAPRIADPAVRSAVMSAVGEDANRIEGLRANSAPFRQTMNRVDDAETTTLSGLRPGTGGSVTQISTILRNKVDIARKRIGERIADGEDADAVFNEEMGKVAAERVRLTKPRAPAARN
jgi:hypothetical protein